MQTVVGKSNAQSTVATLHRSRQVQQAEYNHEMKDVEQNDNDLSDRLAIEDYEAAKYDPAQRELITLSEAIEEGPQTAEDIILRSLSYAPIQEERAGKRVLEHESVRSSSRVLFVTKDQSYIDPDSTQMKTMFSLAALIDELHIIVLVSFGSREQTKRHGSNVWIYRTSAQYWWLTPFAARSVAKEQLSFADGFRADVVVALDPYESGLSAYLIGRHFDRPVQIHVSEDFTSDGFLKAEKGNQWRRHVARFVLRRADSIRTRTGRVRTLVQSIAKDVSDIHMLPRLYNFKQLIDAKPQFDVHEKYQQFVFTILAFGELRADSHLHDTFSALHAILHNPRIGLIIIGDGPARPLFEEKVEILGIKKNVVFLPKADDLVSYLKTADVLVETGVQSSSEEHVLMAAAAGLPLVMYETELRKDMFKDGESATLVPLGDVYTLSRSVSAFVNHQSLRIQYSEAAQYMVKTRLVEDEVTHYRALRDSIEVVIAKPDIEETKAHTDS